MEANGTCVGQISSGLRHTAVTQSPPVRLGGGALLALALIAAACGGGGHNTTSRATTTAEATTTTVDPTKAAILAAYHASWDDFIAVSGTYPVRPLDPRLAAHDTGKQLIGVQKDLTRLMVLRHYDQGTTELHPIVTSISGDTAIVMDCDFDHSVEVDGATNAAVEQAAKGHSLLRFTMTRVNGVWFVADSTILKDGKTGDACTPSGG